MFIRVLIFKLVVPAAIFLAALLAVAWTVVEVNRSSRTVFSAPEISPDRSGRSVARGATLYYTRGCADCHGEDLGGKTFIKDKYMGHFSGSNLTTGAGGIASNYPEAKDWARAIRFGTKPNNLPLMFMPSNEYTHLSERDTGALIAYIQSVPAVNRELPPSSPGPLAQVLFLAGQLPILFPYRHVDDHFQQPADVPIAVTADYGKYLAEACMGCHRETLEGGRIPGVPFDWPPAPNIRSTGVLARYTLYDFQVLLRSGRTANGRQVNQKFMPWPGMARLQDGELEALYLFLKSLR